MMMILATGLALLSIPPVFLTFLLLAEVAASLKASRSKTETDTCIEVSLCVVIPAHDEELGIAATLSSVKEQLVPGRDRLVVVADNCRDGTAEIARLAGAEVVVRSDPSRRGKGYALDWGVRYIKTTPPPDVVIFIDADCRLEPLCLARLAALVAESGRPVQGAYLMIDQPSVARARRSGLRSFAFRLRNFIRPLGGRNLGIPSPLSGAGMAFRWDQIADAPLATDHLAEDMKLGVDLALAGHPPIFSPDAVVLSDFPRAASALDKQKKRWMYGHLQLIRSNTPKLLSAAILQRDIGLLGMALDQAVPPLGLLVAIDFVVSILTGGIALAGAEPWLLAPAILSFPALIGAISIAAMVHGRGLVTASDLVDAIGHAASQLAALPNMGARPVRWERTDRAVDRDDRDPQKVD